jgi:hypothetical protein
MAFDLSTARPVQQPTGFDISTAQPVQPQIDPNILAQAQQRDPSLIPAPEIGVRTFVDPALTLATGAIAEPVAGVIGAATAALPFTAEGSGAGVADIVREKLTFQPTTAQGQAGLRAVGGVAEKVVGALDAVNQFGRDIGVPEVLLRPAADVAFEQGGPLAGAVVAAIPTAILEFLGLRGLQTLRPGSKLLKPDGRPTKLLENKLDKQGLVFDNLSPEAKATIPEVAPKRLIPGGREVAGPSENILVEQIKSGAKDNALAGLKVVKDQVVPDKAGLEAIRQGFDDGFVQAVKTASPESKSGMKQMLDITQRISKNRRLALDIRPTDVVGNSLSKRITFIRDKATQARKELNNIATTQLRGQSVDGAPVVTKLQESLANLDIELIDGPGGIPEPVFRGSLISKDKAAQRAIRNVIDLMAEGVKPDALRFHKLKRQLDNMIDFNKKSAAGLSDAGRNVLKDIRSSLNESVRAVNPDYARVNDVLSSSLTALDDFQKVAGSSIDIFGEGSAKAIGQDMRGLMSNRKSRVRLENNVNQINQVASDLGGVFGDDIKDLALFANSIEDRFGAVAQTSFKGEIESAITRAGQQGAKATAAEAVIGAVAKGAEKLRGINDLNAFRAMSDILNK